MGRNKYGCLNPSCLVYSTRLCFFFILVLLHWFNCVCLQPRVEKKPEVAETSNGEGSSGEKAEEAEKEEAAAAPRRRRRDN